MIDLDVDAPDKVPAVLRSAAVVYWEKALWLTSAWEDPDAGKVWARIALILERAADTVEKTLDGGRKLENQP